MEEIIQDREVAEEGEVSILDQAVEEVVALMEVPVMVEMLEEGINLAIITMSDLNIATQFKACLTIPCSPSVLSAASTKCVSATPKPMATSS